MSISHNIHGGLESENVECSIKKKKKNTLLCYYEQAGLNSGFRYRGGKIMLIVQNFRGGKDLE